MLKRSYYLLIFPIDILGNSYFVQMSVSRTAKPGETTIYSEAVAKSSLFEGLPKLTGTVKKLTVPESTDEKQLKLEAQIQGYMGRKIRFGINDGREFEGILICYDSLANLLVEQCVQTKPIYNDPGLVYLNMSFVKWVKVNTSSPKPTEAEASSPSAAANETSTQAT